MSSYGTAILKPAGLLELSPGADVFVDIQAGVAERLDAAAVEISTAAVVAEVLACLVLLTFTRLGGIPPDQRTAASARRRPARVRTVAGGATSEYAAVRREVLGHDVGTFLRCVGLEELADGCEEDIEGGCGRLCAARA
jgi:hypothetical protein